MLLFLGSKASPDRVLGSLLKESVFPCGDIVNCESRILDMNPKDILFYYLFHTTMIAHLRVILVVEIQAGNQTTNN